LVTPTTLRSRLSGGDLTTVSVLGPTSCGQWRSISIPAEHFMASLDTRDGVPKPLQLPIESAGPYAPLAPSLLVDLATLRAADWAPGTAIALADACTSTGTVDPRSPRQAIEQAISKLDGYGVELEAVVTTQMHVVSAHPSVEADFEGAVVRLCSKMHRAGVRVQHLTTSPAFNRSAFAVTFSGHSDALTVCDDRVLDQLAATAYAEQCDLLIITTRDLSPGCRCSLSLKLSSGQNATLVDRAFAGLLRQLQSIATIQSRLSPPNLPHAVAGVIALEVPTVGEGLHETMASVLEGFIFGLRERLPCAESRHLTFVQDRTGVNRVGEIDA
jgi:hypothetical protein